ncbi:MAG: hypothetical protein ACKOGO_02365 [Holophagaceae bacterium]|jgi:hypothetical protein
MLWFSSRFPKVPKIEPLEDTQLRSDFAEMLGLKVLSEPTSIAESHRLQELAQSLYREALRRRRTLRQRSRLSWMLAAAALPIIFALGSWGITQHHKAKVLAQQIEQNRIEQKRLVDANQNLQRVIQDAQLQLAKDRQKYLVIPLPNRENSVNQMNTVKVRNKTN